MYLNSILHTISEIRTEIETALKVKCHILIRSLSKDSIEVQIDIPEHDVHFARQFTAVQIAGMEHPTTAMVRLKEDAKELLGQAIFKQVNKS